MTAKVISISKHRRYEHAYLSIYKKWINRRREAHYESKGWALEPVPLASSKCPSLNSIFYYRDVIEAYRIKLEVDSINACSKGKVLEKPEIFSRDILKRCKLLDEAIASNFRGQNGDYE